MEHLPVAKTNGARFQSGIPTRNAINQPLRARGLMLRGTVVATYVVDDSTHPLAQGIVRQGPRSVYCDVITYGGRPGQQTRLIKQCLVLQRRGGLHDGDIWIPKATTQDVSGSDLDRNVGSNCAYWDGDHVLVGFVDDDVALPIIMGGLEHPSADAGVESQGEAAGERRRLKLRLVDKHPDFTKHHGSHYGIDENGNHKIDTRFANDGNIDDLGAEPAPPTDGKGAQTAQIPTGAHYQVTIEDMSTPSSPQIKATLTVDQGKLDLTFESGFQLIVDDGTTLVTLGGDDEEASVDSKIQTELARIKGEIDNLKWKLGSHRHPVPEFPIPLLFGDIVGCFKQPAIYLVKGNPPINLRTGSEVKSDNAPADDSAGDGEFFGTTVQPTLADLFPGGETPGDTASTVVKIKG